MRARKTKSNDIRIVVSVQPLGKWRQRVSVCLNVLILAFGLSPTAPVAYAQELLPELAEPAAKHKAADEALDKQKQEAVAVAAKSYVSALDGIEKAATAKNDLDQVAAAVKEREAAVSGTLESDLPAALPKAKLQNTRKALLASLERINADFAKRKKQADADYLRFLATLQPKAARIRNSPSSSPPKRPRCWRVAARAQETVLKRRKSRAAKMLL